MKRQFLALVSTIALSCAAFGASSAQAIDSSDPDYSKLDQGEILVTTSNIKGSDVPKATVRAVVDAPPEKVWGIVSNCENYKTNMPRIASSELIEKNGDTYICKVVAEMSFPFSNLTSKTKATHKIGNGVWKRSWYLLEGDYETNTGAWTVTKFDDAGTRTYLTYELHADPKIALPKSIVSSILTGALPDTIKNIRKRVK